MKALRYTLFKALAGAGAFALLLETVLRLCPFAIPAKALVNFEPALRSRLARGRFTTLDQTVIMPRDDGGPPLRLFKPFTDKVYSLAEAEAATVVTTDEIGFGNPPGRYAAAPAFDLIAVGDSFTWPHAVRPEEAWPLRLSALTGLSAYNLGRGGTGLYEYLQILKRFGLPKSPAIVILNVYEGNDIRDAVYYRAYRNGKTPWDAEGDAVRKDLFLWRHSYAWNLLLGSAIYLRQHCSQSRREGQVDYRFSLAADGRSIAFNSGQGARDEVVYAQRAWAGEFDFTVFREALEAFHALAVQHGFAPVIAYTPAAHTVYAPVAFADPDLQDILSWFSQEQRRHLSRASAELGLHFADLTAGLQAAAANPTEKTLLYFPSSLHYTARGHAVAAGILAQRLEELGVLQAARQRRAPAATP